MTVDPYAPHLERARTLFGAGEVLQAGQIWQAILKKQPEHVEARTGLLKVKQWMEAKKAIEPPAEPTPAPTLPTPAESPPAPPTELPPYAAGKVHKSTVPYKPFKAPEPVSAEPEEAPAERIPEPPAPAHADDEPTQVERLLKEGCTLFDMGQTEDALLKWEQILEQDPGHALARAYIAQAQRELGYETHAIPEIVPLPATAAPAPIAASSVGAEELLRRASQLYEMGSLEESIASLEQILVLDPAHADAQRFLLLARRELAESTPPAHVPPPPTPAYTPQPPPAPQSPAAPPPMPSYAAPTALQPQPAAAPPRLDPKPAATPAAALVRGGSDTLEQKLSQGERLLLLGRYEEADFAFQMALSAAPNDTRAREGLRKAREMAAPSMAPTLVTVQAPAETAPPALPAAAPPKPVQPPAALTAPAPATRQGPELPRTLQELSQHPLLGSTKFLVGGAVLVVVLGIGVQVFQKQRKDARLRAAVAQARDSAVGPLAGSAQVQDLTESAASLRQEAESILAYDPVRAYHRAKELLRRDSADPVGAVLLEKAKAAMEADPVPGVSLTEFNRLQAAGDLEGAERAVDALLRARPEDSDLMQRAARLQRVLAGLHASKGEWAEARTALQKGRALYPQDRSWQSRLVLLDRVQALPKREQAGWLCFFG